MVVQQTRGIIGALPEKISWLAASLAIWNISISQLLNIIPAIFGWNISSYANSSPRKKNTHFLGVNGGISPTNTSLGTWQDPCARDVSHWRHLKGLGLKRGMKLTSQNGMVNEQLDFRRNLGNLGCQLTIWYLEDVHEVQLQKLSQQL